VFIGNTSWVAVDHEPRKALILIIEPTKSTIDPDRKTVLTERAETAKSAMRGA